MLDLGSGGGLDSKWRGLKSLCNLVGFDPNESECRRMEQANHGLRSARYFPHAVGESNGTRTMYRTRSPWCNSLLRPRGDWLERLEFHRLFEIEGTEQINIVSLKSVKEVQEQDFDILKLDVQGMELPILRNSGRVLEDAFAVETETGFIQNYEGETTFGEIDLFMREQGFRLFDLTTHRQPRCNTLGRSFRSCQQLIVAEAIWLKDYVQHPSDGHRPALTRKKCLAVLAICAALRTYDFGYELAQYFCNIGVLQKEDCIGLDRVENWMLDSNKASQRGLDCMISVILLFPRSIRKMFSEAARAASDRKAWISRLR